MMLKRGIRLSCALALACAALAVPSTAMGDYDWPGMTIPMSPIEGSLDSPGDNADVYEVWLDAGESFLAAMKPASGCDFNMALYEPGATGLDDFAHRADESENVGVAREESIDYRALAAGPYKLAVYAPGPGAGNYTIEWYIGNDTNDNDVPGYRLGSPLQQGTLNAATDITDVYRVYLSAGDTFNVDLSGPVDADYDLYLYVPGTPTVEEWEDYCIDWSEEDLSEEQLSFPVTGSGFYYLCVYAWEGSGYYDLTWDVDPGVPQTRVEGTSRISTAIESSKQAFDSSEYVIIATAFNWPDALGGSALAGALDAPILLTAPAALSGGLSAEISRLGATKAVILGGTPAVSANVENQLKGILGADKVERLGGANRYQTANIVAARTILQLSGQYEGKAFIATGANFPDALGASPIAFAKKFPIYLANPSAGANSSLISTMKASDCSEAIILGGENVVSPAVSAQLASQGIGQRRLSGPNRYATALMVAGYGMDYHGLTYDKLAIATGQNFPDALAGGVLQGKSNSVMMLTPTASLYQGVADTLSSHKASIHEVRFLGGSPAVSEDVRVEVLEALD